MVEKITIQPDRLREALNSDPTATDRLRGLRRAHRARPTGYPGEHSDACICGLDSWPCPVAQALDQAIAALAAPAPDLTEQDMLDALDREFAAEDAAPAPDLVLVRRDSGGVLPDGTTNTPAIDFDGPPEPSAPAPDLIAEHVHDAEVCFGCAEVHERALAEQDITEPDLTAVVDPDREMARGLIRLLHGNARFTDAYERDVNTVVGFIVGLRSVPASREADYSDLVGNGNIAALATPAPDPDEWTALAKDIRIVDGNHDLGAGELAQDLIERGWTRSPSREANHENRK